MEVGFEQWLQAKWIDFIAIDRISSLTHIEHVLEG